MGITKKYRSYIWMLKLSLFLNVFLLGFGLVAFNRWLQDHDLTNAEMSFVGLGALIFGIALPSYIFFRISTHILKLKKQTEQMVTRSVAEWIVALEDYEKGDAFKDPKFWINLALVLVETMGEHSTHPVAQILAEVAPTFRKELKSAAKRHETAQ